MAAPAQVETEGHEGRLETGNLYVQTESLHQGRNADDAGFGLDFVGRRAYQPKLEDTR